MALEASVGAAQQGDRAALEYVLREVRPQVAALALRFFGCPDHAQDATQEVMLQILAAHARSAATSVVVPREARAPDVRREVPAPRRSQPMVD